MFFRITVFKIFGIFFQISDADLSAARVNRPVAQEMQPKKTRGRPRTQAPERPGATVQSLDRAAGLLRALARSDKITLTELALGTGMAPSTAHRLLTTLQHHGLTEFHEPSQNWMIGVEAFRIGNAFIRRVNVVEAGRAEMRRLMETSGETANMAIADGGDVVFVSQVETQEPIRAFFRPGTRGHMHASGIGKALLAEFTRHDVEQILTKKGLPAFTPNTITSAAALFDDLAATRARGWAIDDEERTIGMRCLAAPIFNEFGEPVAGVSISGPTVRLPDERLGEIGPEIKRAAARITDEIGGRR